ncbi:hypothetical protein FRC00_002819 [Tulasnella sp. 408]|nr:hypothetical protein FRC00_002819 [Tulasnella sp. 408]
MASDLALPVKVCAAVVTCTTYAVIFIVVLRVVKDWWTRKEWPMVRRARDDARSCMETHPGHCSWRDWRTDTLSAIKGEDESWVFVDPPSTTVSKLLLGWHRIIRLIAGLPSPPLTTDSPSHANSTQRLTDTLPIVASSGIPIHPAECAVSEISMTPGLPNVQSKKRPVLPTPKGSLVYVRPPKVVLNPINDSQFQLDDLKQLQPVHTLPIFHPVGYDMHFSPDGKYLGVGCIEEAVAIWKVGSVYGKPEIVLPSPTGRFGWSPDGSYVLVITKTGPSILKKGDTWGLQCQPAETGPINVVAWLQSSRAFILATYAGLRVFDMNTQLQPTPHAPIILPIEAHDIASIPNASKGQYGFILVLGSLHDETAQKDPEPDGPDMRVDEPSVVCPEHWLMVIDLDAPGGSRSLAEAPTLASARHICVSRDGHYAIISCYSVEDSPRMTQERLWGEIAIPDSGLQAKHASESTIYIWDRYSGFLVHTLEGDRIRPQIGNDSGITAITSTVKPNDKASPIVVSACKRGGVIVWEYPDREEGQAESASEGETSKAGARQP